METTRYPRLRQALSVKFELLGDIDRGRYSCVIHARDLQHQRSVAIKVLRPELARAIGKRRFLHEIEFIARLQHAHILPLYDSGEIDNFLYYVTPYIEGGSLRRRLARENALPLDEAVRIAIDVCSALGHAHAHDIIHRDISPQNVLLQKDSALVSDFGLGRALDAAKPGPLTPVGCIVGTPGYMSPEQASGDQPLDGRSDLYSLGCVLYEMLSGQPPFVGATAFIVRRMQMAAELLPITQSRPEVSRELEKVLEKVLEKSPDRRYQTAEGFHDALLSVPASQKITRRSSQVSPL